MVKVEKISDNYPGRVWNICTFEEYSLLGCNTAVHREPDVSEEYITSIFKVEE
jgi:hypothetical protein